jgi:hypothetical protein
MKVSETSKRARVAERAELKKPATRLAKADLKPAGRLEASPKRDLFAPTAASLKHVSLNTAGILATVDQIRPVHLDELDTRHGRGELRASARSLAALGGLLADAAQGRTRETIEPATARHQVNARNNALNRAEDVLRGLEATGWRDKPTKKATLNARNYIEALRADLASLTHTRDAALAERPAGAKGIDFSDPQAAARSIGKSLGDPRLERLADVTSTQNLAALAHLVDDVVMGPDYASLGMGWHHPSSRIAYRARAYDAWNQFASEPRRNAVTAELRQALGAALEGRQPGKAVEKVLTQVFVKEIGADPAVAKTWKPNVAAIREAIAKEAFVPLRALNETVDAMAPSHPEARPELKAVLTDITRHIVEGDYEQWRLNNPASRVQLESLTAAQRGIWEGPTSIQSKGPNGVELTTREEKGVDLLWVTKIGGPSHGFDYNGHCLMPLLSNARSTPILVEDPRWPSNAAARAYLRLLTTTDGKPVLYLEPLQRDFPHREALRDSEHEDESFELALIRHAAAKAKAMDVPLSLSTSLRDVAKRAGLAYETTEKQYVLLPSAGVFEASDTLTDKHDWIQTKSEDTLPLRRLWVDPKSP